RRRHLAPAHAGTPRRLVGDPADADRGLVVAARGAVGIGAAGGHADVARALLGAGVGADVVGEALPLRPMVARAIVIERSARGPRDEAVAVRERGGRRRGGHRPRARRRRRGRGGGRRRGRGGTRDAAVVAEARARRVLALDEYALPFLLTALELALIAFCDERGGLRRGGARSRQACRGDEDERSERARTGVPGGRAEASGRGALHVGRPPLRVYDERARTRKPPRRVSCRQAG